MQRKDKTSEEKDPEQSRSRAGSRRNSDTTVISRKNSARKTPQKYSNPTSNVSTPKKSVVKAEKLEFMVTGKPLLKKSDRANSMPSGYARRLSSGSVPKKKIESPRVETSHSSRSRETSLEDDMSLDLSQVSDFEEQNSKCGVKKKFAGIAASTPKSAPKPRSGSLQSQRYSSRMTEGSNRGQQSFDSSRRTVSNSISGLSFSQDSYNHSSAASNYRYGPTTELGYSSVSPEYSGQSSAETSPRASDMAVISPSSLQSLTSWVDSSDLDKTKIDQSQGHRKENGEWNTFWANYNNSISRVPMKNYYDQCPTPYRTENIDLADLDFSGESAKKRSPEGIKTINNIIRNEGMHLTPRETQNIIKCAHILGSVLSRAIDRNSKQLELNEEKIQEMELQSEAKPIDPEVDSKKKVLSLNLRESNKPLEVEEEKKCETVTTQTDISLPNTKSAPRIFEKILRQLSKSSIDEGILSEKRKEKSDDSKTDEAKKNNNLLQP